MRKIKDVIVYAHIMKKLSLTQSARVGAILFVSGFVAVAQVDPLTGLDDYIARAMTTFQVPGVAVAVVKDGKVVLAKGSGVRKLGEKASIGEHRLPPAGPRSGMLCSQLRNVPQLHC